jgi:hypothetical protein
VILCAQIITEQAILELRDSIQRNKILYGIKFDNSFRVNSDDCAMFRNRTTLLKVRKLCEWFGDTVFLKGVEKRFDERLRLHCSKGGNKNYAYGWRDCGYTIVTEPNCPSNSVPLLYYTPFSIQDLPIMGADIKTSWYLPPFPRTESRESHQVSADKTNLSKISTDENIRMIQKAFK